MGVLDIRMRSATLGNYGSVATANPLNLSRVGSILNQNDEVKAHSLSQGIGQVGKLVNMGIDMYAQVQKREDERKMQEAANAVQDRFNTHMYGDGSAGSGAFNTPFTDGKEWMDKNGEAYKKIIDEVSGTDKNVGGLSLSAGQKRRLVAGLEGYRRGWWNQQARKADSFYDEKEMSQAKRGSEIADSNLLIEYSDKNFEDWFAAKKRFVEVNQLQGRMTTPEEVEAYYRGEALKVVKNEFHRRLEECAIECADKDDPKWVGECYDRLASDIKDEPEVFIPKNDEFRKLLGKNGIGSNSVGKDGEKVEPTGVYKDMLVAIGSAKKTAVAQADVRHNKKLREEEDKFYTILPDIQKMESGTLKAQKFREVAAQYKETNPRFYSMIMAKADLAEDEGKREAAQAARALSAEARAKRASDNERFMRAAVMFQFKPDGLSEDEAIKWREQRVVFDQEYLAAYKSGRISHSTVLAIQKLMDSHYSDEVKRAVIAFDERLGLENLKVGRSGDLSSILKELSSQPLDEGMGGRFDFMDKIDKSFLEGKSGPRQKEMSTAPFKDILKWRNEYIRLLGTMPNGVDKEAYAKASADRVLKMLVQENAGNILTFGLKTVYDSFYENHVDLSGRVRARMEELYKPRDVSRPENTPVEEEDLDDESAKILGVE